MALRIALFLGVAWLALSTGRGDPLKSLDGRVLDTPPRVLREAILYYPDFLADQEIGGTAVVEFVLTERGDIVSPRVTQVSHPAFVPPAIDALLRSKFAPGRIGGAPVSAGMTTLFEFGVERYGHRVSREPFTVPQVSAPGTAPEFRYDVAPRLVTLCEPVYPFPLLLEGVRGEAEVRFVVDPGGRCVAGKVLSASRPEFGAALLAAVQTWHFTPPTFEGRRTRAILSKAFRFFPHSRELAADDDTARIVRQLRAGSEKIATLAALDHQPRAFFRVAPTYPPVLDEQGVSGEAEIKFIIDRKGRARAPQIVSATHEEFGWAAATAVQQWFYEPPLVQGKPVDVRVTLPFGFAPPPRTK